MVARYNKCKIIEYQVLGIHDWLHRIEPNVSPFPKLAHKSLNSIHIREGLKIC